VPTVTYVPQSADDPSTVQWGGMTLKAGEAVETNDRRLLTKADGNKYFKVSASEEEMGEAEREVVGGYYDTNSGQEVSLVRVPRSPTYATSIPPQGTVPPSSATQGRPPWRRSGRRRRRAATRPSSSASTASSRRSWRPATTRARPSLASR
jgi:hypothetical protein